LPIELVVQPLALSNYENLNLGKRTPEHNSNPKMSIRSQGTEAAARWNQTYGKGNPMIANFAKDQLASAEQVAELRATVSHLIPLGNDEGSLIALTRTIDDAMNRFSPKIVDVIDDLVRQVPDLHWALSLKTCFSQERYEPYLRFALNGIQPAPSANRRFLIVAAFALTWDRESFEEVLSRAINGTPVPQSGGAQ
jgi:hypothetical protein